MSGHPALSAALAYAGSGWPVFPCRPNAGPCPRPGDCQCKAPAIPAAHPKGDPSRGVCTGECGRYGHGFHDATTDPAVIRSWWSRWPDANVAIATGEPGPDVLDVDVKPTGSGYPAFNRLRQAGLLARALALIETPSRGLHVYLTGTSQGCHTLPRHHVDYRSRGGYVLAPPSRVHGKPYQLLDHRAADGRLDWQAVVRLLDTRNVSTLSTRNSARLVAADSTRLVAWVAALSEGNRNAGLFWAACRMAESGADNAEQLVSAAVQAGLSEPEARRTVASAARRVAG